jgi:hypothetical protein
MIMGYLTIIGLFILVIGIGLAIFFGRRTESVEMDDAVGNAFLAIISLAFAAVGGAVSLIGIIVNAFRKW